jgi:Tfp pilus assembly protein PilW
MDERDLCALHLFHALCAFSARCDKWVSQSVYERNTHKEFSRTNRNGNVEFSRRRRQHKQFQVCSVVLDVGAEQPSGSSLQVTYRGCMATSLQQDLQGVALFVGRQPCDLLSSGGPGMSLGMALRVMQTSPRSGGTVVEEELLCYNIFYLKFTGDGQNNRNS